MIYKTGKDPRGKIVTSLMKSGRNEDEACWKGLGEPREAYMYTVHIRIEGGEICEKLKPRKPSLSAYRC